MEYTEDQLTEWFDIDKQKPLAPGVYLVFMEYGVERYSFFNGDRFNYVVSPESIYPIDNSFDRRNDEGAGGAVRKWRGLNFNPNAPTKPTKPTNKRKTMYVVHAWLQRGEVRKVVGSYTSLNEALKKKVRYKQAWIEKIRFRTPEA